MKKHKYITDGASCWGTCLGQCLELETDHACITLEPWYHDERSDQHFFFFLV